MRVLAIDTVTEGCSAALLITDARGIATVIDRHEDTVRGSADLILEMVDGLLAEVGMSLGRLDGIAVGVGPGAFTGVRISVSVGQALAFGSGLPVVPVTSLEALAAQITVRPVGAARPEAIVAALDARMGEVYWGCFGPADTGSAEDLQLLMPLQIGPPSSVQWPAHVESRRPRGIGRGFHAYPQIAAQLGAELAGGDARALPRARESVRLGAARLRRGLCIEPAKLTPVYLRNKVALTETERRVQGLAP